MYIGSVMLAHVASEGLCFPFFHHLYCVLCGYQNAQNPVEDFRRIPPGLLALSNMVYFAQNYRENYTKVSISTELVNHI